MDKNKLILPISILLGCIILGGFYYASQVNKQKSIEKQQQIEIEYEKQKNKNFSEPWKPEKNTYSINEEINYGVINLKVNKFEKQITNSKPLSYYDFKDKTTKNIEESKVEELTIIQITIKNSYINKNKIYISEQQFTIKDGVNTLYPIIFDDLFLKPSIRGKTLSSGEEITGYLFFRKLNFNNPILEANLLKGSYPIQIKLIETKE